MKVIFNYINNIFLLFKYVMHGIKSKHVEQIALFWFTCTCHKYVFTCVYDNTNLVYLHKCDNCVPIPLLAGVPCIVSQILGYFSTYKV